MLSEKTLESPLDYKEIQLVHPKENQSWIFFGRTDDEAETPVVWPPDAKNWLTGKDSDAGKDWRKEKGTIENEMVGRHHRLDGHESEWTPGVGYGQGGLACCDSWGHRVGHDWATHWTELNWTLAWQIPWTEQPGRLQSTGSLGVGHDWATSLALFTFTH